VCIPFRAACLRCLSCDTLILANQQKYVKRQIIVCFWLKGGIFEPEKPHKIRDLRERASSTHHEYSPIYSIILIPTRHIYTSSFIYTIPFLYLSSSTLPTFALLTSPILNPTTNKKPPLTIPQFLSPILSTLISPIKTYPNSHFLIFYPHTT